MKKIFKLLLVACIAVVTVFSLTGCVAKEVNVQHNLLKETGDFKTYRKITVINLRSDKVLMEFVGYLTSTLDDEGDVNIIIMTGPDKYQLHYVRLANEVTYISEQLDNTTTDPYHWEVNIYAILPEVNVG